MSKPYRARIFDECGKPLFEIKDPDPEVLMEKTSKIFKEKFR